MPAVIARSAACRLATPSRRPADPLAAATKWRGVTRFYKDVDVEVAPSDSVPATFSTIARAAATTGATWYRVLIDGRQLHTSNMNALLSPTAALAHAIATEFRLQRGVILPPSQPLYNLLSAAIDTYVTEDASGNAELEARQRAGRLASMDVATTDASVTATAGASRAGTPSHTVAAVTGRHDSGAMTASTVGGVSKLRDLALDYLETDTLCFRVDADGADPSETLLLKRQRRYYDPILSWWRDTYGHELGVAVGFGDIAHPEDAYIVAEDHVDTADALARSALHLVLSNTKSTALTLALLHGAVDVETAFECARVEEEHQIRENGFVEDGHDTARAQLRVALTAAHAFLAMAPESAASLRGEATQSGKRRAGAEDAGSSMAMRRARVAARRKEEAALVERMRREMREASVAEAARAATRAQHAGALQ